MAACVDVYYGRLGRGVGGRRCGEWKVRREKGGEKGQKGELGDGEVVEGVGRGLARATSVRVYSFLSSVMSHVEDRL